MASSALRRCLFSPLRLSPRASNTVGPRLPSAAESSGRCDDCFAVVNRDGTLARGKGVRRTASLDGGDYEVIFRRNVTRCAFVATIGRTEFVGVEEPGFITVAGRFLTTNGVFVQRPTPPAT